MNHLTAIALGALLLLSACTNTLKSPANQALSEQEHRAKINALNTWQIQGAIAARYKTDSWTASINWSKTNQNDYTLRLFGPLASGTVRITKRGNIVTYQDGPKQITSTNASKLLEEQTGIRLPINSLYYWVKGTPAPGHATLERYNDHQLAVLKQFGYTVTYSQYRIINGLNLPTKLRLEGNGLKVKLLVKKWTI